MCRYIIPYRLRQFYPLASCPCRCSSNSKQYFPGLIRWLAVKWCVSTCTSPIAPSLQVLADAYLDNHHFSCLLIFANLARSASRNKPRLLISGNVVSWDPNRTSSLSLGPEPSGGHCMVTWTNTDYKLSERARAKNEPSSHSTTSHLFRPTNPTPTSQQLTPLVATRRPVQYGA